MASDPTPGPSAPDNFLQEIVAADLKSGKHVRVHTRFPPEPNGYLHIGHAKSICLNFGLAREFGGLWNLRFDDTNPETEEIEYVESIQNDVRWLGFDWDDRLYFASDYFEKLYEFAEELIQTGKAYVCSLNEEQIREYRGTISEPGRPSPYRERSPEENLDLFRRMRKGEFPDGAHVLRAKIDMASANMKMRDPLLYRIRHSEHYRRGDAWCIYPFYDFTHCLSDAIERHHAFDLHARIREQPGALRLGDRKRQLPGAATPVRVRAVEPDVHGDEQAPVARAGRERPRLRLGRSADADDQRAQPPRRDAGSDPRVLRADRREQEQQHRRHDAVRALRSRRSQRARAAGLVRAASAAAGDRKLARGPLEELEAPYWPHDVPREGSRALTFSRVLYIERDDFMEEPPKDFFRLAPGREVRLRHAYVIRCTGVVKDERGEVVELRCSYDPETRGDSGHGGGRKVKGTIHWVNAEHSLPVEVRLYDRLFKSESPGGEGKNFIDDLNPDSLLVLNGHAERGLAQARAGDRFQFERQGFFFVDPHDSAEGRPVFNRIVALKDTWGKIASKATDKAASPPESKAARDKAAKKPAPKLEIDPAAAALRDRHGLSTEEAKVLASDADLSALFEAVLASKSVQSPLRASSCVSFAARSASGGSPLFRSVPPRSPSWY